MARKLLVTDQTARLAIGATAGFVAISELIPAEGQKFTLPGFQAGLLPVYLPLSIAIMSFMRFPGLSVETQKGLLIVLTSMMVGTRVFNVILGGEFSTQNIVGSVIPAIAAIELAV
jgi:hypothetical protein